MIMDSSLLQSGLNFEWLNNLHAISSCNDHFSFSNIFPMIINNFHFLVLNFSKTSTDGPYKGGPYKGGPYKIDDYFFIPSLQRNNSYIK